MEFARIVSFFVLLQAQCLFLCVQYPPHAVAEAASESDFSRQKQQLGITTTITTSTGEYYDQKERDGFGDATTASFSTDGRSSHEKDFRNPVSGSSSERPERDDASSRGSSSSSSSSDLYMAGKTRSASSTRAARRRTDATDITTSTIQLLTQETRQRRQFSSEPTPTSQTNSNGVVESAGANLCDKAGDYYFSVTECGERTSCRNRCGTGREGAGARTDCSCDSHCKIYNDCCWDITTTCPTVHELATNLSRFDDKPVWTCQGIGLNKAVLLTSECPSSWDNDAVRAKCVKDRFNDPLSIIPVTDPITGLHYKNYYCAQCHGTQRPLAWNISVECDRRTEVHAPTVERLLHYINRPDCLATFAPTGGRPLRRCHPSVSYCPTNCSNQELVENCQSFPAYVHLQGTVTTYRNEWCALCNGIPQNTQELKCGPRSPVTLPPIARTKFGIALAFKPGSRGVEFAYKPSSGMGSTVFQCRKLGKTLKGCKITACIDEFVLKEGRCELRYKLVDLQVQFKYQFRPNNVTDKHSGASHEPDLKGEMRSLLRRHFDTYGSIDVVLLYSGVDQRNWTVDVRGRTKIKLNKTYKVQEQQTARKKIYEALERDLRNLPHMFDIGGRLVNLQVRYGDDVIELDRQVNSAPTDTIPTPCQPNKFRTTELIVLKNKSVIVRESRRIFHVGQYSIDESDHSYYMCANKTYTTPLPYFDNDLNRSLWAFTSIMGLITIICLSVSTFCLLARALLHFFVPVYQTFPGKVQLSLVITLFLANVSFLISPTVTDMWPFCYGIGLLMHWAFLSAFLWMNVIAMDMWRRSRRPNNYVNRRGNPLRFLCYALYAWLLPMFIVGISLSLDYVEIDPFYQPKYARKICWFSQKVAMMIFFAGPIAVIIIATFILLCMTAHVKCTAPPAPRTTLGIANKPDNYRFGIYVELFILMTVTWVFGVLATIIKLKPLWYTFIVLNTLQGVVIFLAFVCTRQVYKSLEGQNSGNYPNSVATTKTSRIYDSSMDNVAYRVQADGRVVETPRQNGMYTRIADDREVCTEIETVL